MSRIAAGLEWSPPHSRRWSEREGRVKPPPLVRLNLPGPLVPAKVPYDDRVILGKEQRTAVRMETQLADTRVVVMKRK